MPDNELALAEACKEKGPISVAIDGAWISLRFYKSGVYYEPQCFTTKLNHGVLLVGYGTEADTEADAGKEFYLVKNSWGTGWGMDGYFKMARILLEVHLSHWLELVAYFKHTAFYASVLHDNIETLWISILLFRLAKTLKVWCAKRKKTPFTIPNSRSMQHMGPVPYSVPEMEEVLYFALMFASMD